MLHLLCHGHLQGPVTLTPIAERLAVELSLPVFYNLGLVVYCGWDLKTQTSACAANALSHCANAAGLIALKKALNTASILAYPLADDKMILDTDALNYSIGAFLSQEQDVLERVISY